MRLRLCLLCLLLLLVAVASAQLSRGWTVRRDYPYMVGATVHNSVNHDANDNIILWFTRDGRPTWAKYDAFGNLIRTRTEFGWSGLGRFDPQNVIRTHVNANGRSALLADNTIYAYDADGNRIWWRSLAGILPPYTAGLAVHVSPGGRVLVGMFPGFLFPV